MKAVQPDFYLHDDDKSQLGSQNMPELHSVGVLLLMARRVAVITIPTKKEQRIECPEHLYTDSASRPFKCHSSIHCATKKR